MRFNPLFTEADILKGACRVCGEWFPTKKLLNQHSRKLHPRSRENNMDEIKANNEDNNVDELLLPEEVEFYNNIMDVIEDRNGKYLVNLENGEQAWVVLSEDHPVIAEYLRTNEDDDIRMENDGHERFPLIQNLRDWHRQDFIPLDNNFVDDTLND